MQQTKVPFPVHVLVMDAVGTVMFALGIYGLLIGAELPGLEFLELAEGAWNYIITGILLWIPMGVHVLKLVRERAERNGG